MTGYVAAVKVRMPLQRVGPWITDVIWLAHITHPLVSRFAAVAPRDGTWAPDVHGNFTELDEELPPILEVIDAWENTAQPCRLGIDSIEQLDRLVDVGSYDKPHLTTTELAVADSTGAEHVFDAALVHMMMMIRPAELAEACRWTPHSRSEWYAAVLDEPDMDDLEKARRLWVRVNQSFGKTVAGRSSTGWSSPTVRTQAITTTITNRIDRFKAIAERLCQASIECRDAVAVIDQYGRRGAVIYADPPYLDTTRSTTNNGYRFESKTTEHHEQLAAALHATPATVLLSGYHSPLYDRLYDGWDRVEIPVRCSSSNSTRGDRGSRIEVIWSNRPLTGAQAFDFGTEAS